MKLKFTALILAALMCLGIFASCANNGPTANTRPAGSSSSTDDFPDADYGNEDFTFLYIKHSDVGKDYYGGNYLDSETLEGLTIEDAVYERNLIVEEKYKVNINQRLEINGDPAALLQKTYMAGDFTFDVIYGWTYKLGACIVDNYFADFYELENNGTADLSAEYWSPTMMDDLTVNGKLYLSMNDITMNKLEWAGFLFFNKDLYENNNMEGQFGNLYQLVDEGKWTLDTYLNMLTASSVDLDGDGKITKEDQYGNIEGGHDGASAAGWCGINYTEKNDDGSYKLSIYSEKLLDIISKVNPVYSNDKYIKSYDDIWNEQGDMSGSADQWEYARSFFATDHSLFCSGSAYLTGEFRNMESTYGIVPNPKYDENQENYIVGVSSLASIFALPSTVRTDMSTANMERTGTVLEYMAYQSHEILLPVYYDTLLKGQRLDSDDDSRMLDIIRTNIRGEITSVTGAADIGGTVTKMFDRPAAATSTYNRDAKKLQKELDNFYAEIMLLETKQNSEK